MARFGAKGIEGLRISMEEFERIPDDVVEEMLLAGGAVVERAHKDSIRAMGLINTGKLVNSIKHRKKISRDGKRRVIVYPSGKHGVRHRKQVTKVYKRSKHGRTYTYGGDTKDVTNSEVGFIHEYGASRRNIPARGWMSKANESCAAETTAAMYQVYDTWLKSLNL